MTKDQLFDGQGKAYLGAEYVANRRSTYDIAAELGLYANLIRRALIKHGYELRDRSAAQKAALDSGRLSHPTAGRERTDEERTSIGSSVAGAWQVKPWTPGRRKQTTTPAAPTGTTQPTP
jgi:hypothetical protein